MQVANVPLVVNELLSADFQSPAQQLNQIWGYSIQAEIAGIPSGVVNLQASSDPNNKAGYPINWTDIENSFFTVTAAGSVFWNVTSSLYNFVRLNYVDHSGGSSTAVMNARINIKGI